MEKIKAREFTRVIRNISVRDCLKINKPIRVPSLSGEGLGRGEVACRRTKPYPIQHRLHWQVK